MDYATKLLALADMANAIYLEPEDNNHEISGKNIRMIIDQDIVKVYIETGTWTNDETSPMQKHYSIESSIFINDILYDVAFVKFYYDGMELSEDQKEIEKEYNKINNALTEINVLINKKNELSDEDTKHKYDKKIEVQAVKLKLTR